MADANSFQRALRPLRVAVRPIPRDSHKQSVYRTAARGNRTTRHVYLWDRLLGSLHQVSDLHHNFAASFAGQRTVERLARLF